MITAWLVLIAMAVVLYRVGAARGRKNASKADLPDEVLIPTSYSRPRTSRSNPFGWNRTQQAGVALGALSLAHMWAEHRHNERHAWEINRADAYADHHATAGTPEWYGEQGYYYDTHHHGW